MIIKYRLVLYILFGFVFFIGMVNAVVGNVDQFAIVYNISGGQIGPNITLWSNSKTQDNQQNINLNIGENIKFNVTANQNIDIWRWSKDGIIQNNNYDNFTTSWQSSGNQTISVNGTNVYGTTNTITWNLNVSNQNQNYTTLTACSVLNKTNSVYVLNSNVASNGTCFTIGANNITLEGNGHNVNYSVTATGYGIDDRGGYDNIIVKNLTLAQQNAAVANAHGIYLINVINSRADNINIYTKNNAEGIYLSSSNSNIFSNTNIGTINNGAYGIYLSSSSSNTFSKCNITTRGSNSGAIYTTLSNSNIVSACDITTSGSNADGIYMTSSNYNSFATNILTSGTGASGVRTNSAISNIIKDGSIISKLANDYYLQNSATNNFVNTNFTTRKIYLADGYSAFNYSNNSIGLNTSEIGSSKALTITRSLVNWDKTNISWQEKVSASRTLSYGIVGLLPSTKYSVWNGPVISYNLTTDINGNLPKFNISLTTTANIKVISG